MISRSKVHFVANGIERSDVEIFHVEEAPQLFPDFAEQDLPC